MNLRLPALISFPPDIYEKLEALANSSDAGSVFHRLANQEPRMADSSGFSEHCTFAVTTAQNSVSSMRSWRHRTRSTSCSSTFYVLPHKQAAYDAKYSTQIRGGESFFRQVDREESLVHLLRVNVLKRMETCRTATPSSRGSCGGHSLRPARYRRVLPRSWLYSPRRRVLSFGPCASRSVADRGQ